MEFCQSVRSMCKKSACLFVHAAWSHSLWFAGVNVILLSFFQINFGPSTRETPALTPAWFSLTLDANVHVFSWSSAVPPRCVVQHGGWRSRWDRSTETCQKTPQRPPPPCQREVLQSWLKGWPRCGAKNMSCPCSSFSEQSVALNFNTFIPFVGGGFISPTKCLFSLFKRPTLYFNTYIFQNEFYSTNANKLLKLKGR